MQWLVVRKLRSTDYETRSRAFADVVRKRDIGALLEVLGDPDEYVRSAAIRGLGEIADPQSVPALVGRLDDANFNNQEDAAKALARIGDGRAAGPLVAMLSTAAKHPQARGAAAKALIALADQRAVSGLLEGLRGGDERGRMLILEVIGAIGDGRCVPSVVAALRDPSENVRWQAITTLGTLRDPRATEPLLDLLAAGDGNQAFRRVTIIEALGRIGDPRAGSALAPLLDDPHEDVRTATAAALDAVGWRPADRAGETRRLVAQRRWDELAALGWEVAREPLLRSCKDGDYKIRLGALAGLAHFGDAEALEPLIGALADRDEQVATAAARALAERGNAGAIGALIEHSERYQPAGGYRNDPHAPQGEQSRAADWVKPLETLVASVGDRIGADDLQRLRTMEERTFHLRVEYDTPGYGDGADDFTVTLDYSRVRDLAEDFLRRRRPNQ